MEKYLKDCPEWATHYAISKYENLATMTNAIIAFLDGPHYEFGESEYRYIQIHEEDWHGIADGEIYEIPKPKETEEISDLELFYNSGALLFVNTFLHIFGWAIAIEKEDGKFISMKPIRTSFRGFSNESQTEAYKKLSKYMVENAEELEKESKE